MLKIIKFELKNIFSSKLSKIILFSAIIVIILSSVFDILYYYEIETADEKLKGFKAFNYYIEEDKNSSNKIVDNKNVEEALKELKKGFIGGKINSYSVQNKLDKETYENIYLPNSDYYMFIYNIYYPPFEMNSVGFENLLTQKDKRNVHEAYEGMKENLYKAWMLKENDIDFFKNYEEKIKLPLTTGSAFGYYIFTEYLKKLSFLVFAAGLLLSNIFSKDFEKGSYKTIYSTKYGRKKVTAGKVIAGLILSATLAVIAVAVGYLIVNFQIGFRNGDLPVQNKDITSLMPFTIKELTMKNIGLCFIEFISVAGISMAFSAFSKNSIVTAALDLILFAPYLMYPYNGNVTIMGKIVDLIPFRLCAEQFSALRVYNFFGHKMDFFQFAPAFYTVLILIFYLYSLLRYRKGSLQ